MNIIKLNAGFDNAVASAAALVINGGTLIYPTDTVYGIGCDATNRNAVEKVIAMKQTTGDARFIVLVESFDRLLHFVAGLF